MPRKQRIKLSEELKAAIAGLPDREKNKLLYRLIPKDSILVDQMIYKLLEDGETTEERRADLKLDIERKIRKSSAYFHSIGPLLSKLRQISGTISRHVRVTKDKYGEIELNLFMLNCSLELLTPKLLRFSQPNSKNLDTYIVKRVQKLEKLIAKTHEDYRLDFTDDWHKLIQHIEQLPNTKRMAALLDFYY